MRFTLKYATLIAACAAAFPSYATNGYFLPGYGLRSQGMGGAGIAYGTDSLSIAANPANAVNTGMRGDLGFSIFNPERHASVWSDPSTPSAFNSFSGYSESDLKYFIVPEMGMSMPLTENLHVAVDFVANGGMNTSYPENFFSFMGINPPKDHKVGVDMMQLLVPISVAYRINDNHSVGVSLVAAETRFKAYGLGAFIPFGISSDNAHMTDMGNDYSFGAGIKLGWLGEFMDKRLNVGLSYASKTYMSRFEKYRGLFAEHGKFDIPENYGIGISFKPVSNLVLAADITRINYSKVKSVGDPGPGVFDFVTAGIPSYGDPSKMLGLDNGMGFGWKDQTVYKLGVEYGLNERLILRAGFNYGKSPIPNDQVTFNLLAPATVQNHYSAGFTYKASDILEITGTYMYVAPHSQTACNQNVVDCASFNMHQNVFGLSMGWVLDPGVTNYGDAPMDPINFAGWYVGLGAGSDTSSDWSNSHFNSMLSSIGTTTTSVDNRDLGIKVFSGYQFNKYFALEGGFANFNNFKANSTVSAPAGTLYTTAQNDVWSLSAVGTYPIGKDFTVFAKLGAGNWSSNQRTHASGSVVGTQYDKDKNYRGTDPIYGVGVSYALMDGLDIRAELERYDFGKMNIDFASTGFALKF